MGVKRNLYCRHCGERIDKDAYFEEYHHVGGPNWYECNDHREHFMRVGRLDRLGTNKATPMKAEDIIDRLLVKYRD